MSNRWPNWTTKSNYNKEIENHVDNNSANQIILSKGLFHEASTILVNENKLKNLWFTTLLKMYATE